MLAVFDGSCELCRRCAAFVRRRARADELRLLAADSAAGERALASVGLDPRRCDSLVLVDGGRCFTRSDAVLEVARRLPRLGAASRVLALVPRSLRDAGYDWLARNRHRVCRGGACGTAPGLPGSP